MTVSRPLILATRGSALALAQARWILDQCRREFPELELVLKAIKTTGDQQLTASLARPDPALPKGLFTKELEVALLDGSADLAVHSLKDLPTQLPAGLVLGAVSARADVRDVLIYRDATLGSGAPGPDPAGAAKGVSPGRGFGAGLRPEQLPPEAVVATSSTRRRAQLLDLQPQLRTVEIRGNVLTRLRKLAESTRVDATILAAAGLERLQFEVTTDGWLRGQAVPPGLRAAVIPTDTWLPCVGQAALGIEIRQDDERMTAICQRLNHVVTYHCVAAERALLRALGGGCQTPVAALAEPIDGQLWLRAVSFQAGHARRADGRASLAEAEALGTRIAGQLHPEDGSAAAELA